MNESLAKHSYIIIGALFVSSIFNYLYQVLMGNMLTKPEYGILGVSLSVFYISAILTQNTFSQPAARLISSDPSNAGIYFRTALGGNLLIGFLVSISLIYFALNSAVYFVPILVISISLIATSIGNSLASLFRGFKKFENIALANILNTTSKLLAAVILVSLGFGVLGAISSLLISLIIMIAYLLFSTKVIKTEKSKGWSFNMVVETIPVSLVFLSIAFLINGSIILFRYLGADDLITGSFNAALTIARGTFFFAGALVTVTFPYLASDSSKEYFSFQSLKYVFLFVFPVCLSMASNPEMWLNLFFSSKYHEASSTLIYLSLAVGFISVVQVIASNLVAMERFRIPSLTLFVFSVMFGISAFMRVLEIEKLLLIYSFVIFAVLVLYYIKKFYFRLSVSYLSRIILSYISLCTAAFYMPSGSRLISLVGMLITFSTYFVLISVFRLFDEKDAYFLMSPFPERVRNISLSVVKKLNSLLI